MKKFVALFILALSLGCNTFSNEKDVRPEKIPDSVKLVPEKLPTAKQIEKINSYRNALVQLAGQSATAKELLAFYDMHAIPATAAQSGKFVFDRYKISGFFVSTTPFGTFVNNGQSDCEYRLIILREKYSSSLMNGLILAHELVHMRQCIRQNRESIYLSYDEDELEAYEAESQIIDEATHHAWTSDVVQPLSSLCSLWTCGCVKCPRNAMEAAAPEWIQKLFTEKLSVEELNFLLDRLMDSAELYVLDTRGVKYARDETEHQRFRTDAIAKHHRR